MYPQIALLFQGCDSHCSIWNPWKVRYSANLPRNCWQKMTDPKKSIEKNIFQFLGWRFCWRVFNIGFGVFFVCLLVKIIYLLLFGAVCVPQSITIFRGCFLILFFTAQQNPSCKCSLLSSQPLFYTQEYPDLWQAQGNKWFWSQAQKKGRAELKYCTENGKNSNRKRTINNLSNEKMWVRDWQDLLLTILVQK